MSEVETKSTAMWLFDGILACVEYIGEGVATVMGLNESKYQYVIDSMSENDWKVARDVHALREAQTSTSQRAPEDAESIELKLMETQHPSPSNNLKSEESSAVEEVQKL